MVVLYKAMKKRIGANGKCKQYHAPFKKNIVNDINAKDGQTCHEYW